MWKVPPPHFCCLQWNLVFLDLSHLTKVPDWKCSFKGKADMCLYQRKLKHHLFWILVRGIVCIVINAENYENPHWIETVQSKLNQEGCIPCLSQCPDALHTFKIPYSFTVLTKASGSWVAIWLTKTLLTAQAGLVMLFVVTPKVPGFAGEQGTGGQHSSGMEWAEERASEAVWRQLLLLEC